jgi:hypothetical protein
LPVVQDEHIVAVLTEEDFMDIAAKVVADEEAPASGSGDSQADS